MTQLIFIRHGYSKGNKENRFSGQMDIPLDTLGYRQAEQLRDYLLKNVTINSIYASDLGRACDTVKPIAKALKKAIHTRKTLREVDVGNWQGMLIEDVKEKYPQSFAHYKEKPGLSCFDGGENYSDVLGRVLPTVQKIAKENEGKTAIIGTHGDVIRVLHAAWTGVPLERIEEIPIVPNASVTVVNYENGYFHIVQSGYCDYLTDKTTAECGSVATESL